MNSTATEIAAKLLKSDREMDDRIERGIEENQKGFGRIALQDAAGKPVEQATVRLRMTRHAFHFGANAFMVNQFKEQAENELYEQRFADLLNLAVVPFYWSDLEPQDGKPRFAKDSANIYRRPAPDLVLEFCEKHDITPKGHPLCWHSFVPEWLSTDKAEGAARLERRIREIAERYGERIRIWDVCNEALAYNPYDPKHNVPQSHAEFAFHAASRYLPRSSVLTYNDFMCWDEYHGEYTPFYLLGRHLKELGVNLGALGLQYHMFYGQTLEALRQWGEKKLDPHHLFKCLDLYAGIGVPLNLSEITITAHPDLGDGPGFQKEVTEKLYRLWFSHPATNGIIWWNFVDDTAHVIPDWDENQYKGGMLNRDLSPKPVYSALQRLIHKEWTTATEMQYQAGAENKFRGFYGDYEATVQTGSGEYRLPLKLSKQLTTAMVITLDEKDRL